MFLEYQNEIIALIVILVLLVMYLLITRKTPNALKNEDVIVNDVEPEIQVSQAEPKEEIEEEIEEEITKDLDGSEEGDFGVDETQDKREYSRKSDIKTRDVPQHGKITKQNFKEFAGMRVLVAEDNIINQKVIAGLLAESGIEILIANDGQEVLDILEKDDDFVMILMDAHMPIIDGFEATRAVRANPKYSHIVVVALSGDTAADDIRKMSEAGMEEHLEKPLRMDSLYDVFYAYTGTEEEKIDTDEDFIEVPMTKELNGDKGLAICGEDEGFYLEILNEFINTYADSAQRLRKLLTTTQHAEAAQLLLDIIGVSANIGADPLHKLANELKDSLSDTKEQSYFTILEQYQVHLELLVKDIKEFIKR